MNQNQAAAFIAAQTALMQCRMHGMIAENQFASVRGEYPVYDELRFAQLADEFEPVIGYNATLQLYEHAER
jgi:hypothetical protein